MTAAAALAFLALGALAQQPLEVRRGELQVKVRVAGTVVAEDLVRLKSSIDGRVEEFTASTYTWAVDGDPMGFLANKEMAAIFDSHNTTEKSVLGNRWKRLYDPSAIRCPGDCFVLRTFVRTRQMVKPEALLVEAAKRLVMVGRVRPEDAHLIRDGQTLEFWAVRDPTKKHRARIAGYVLDIQGSRYNPGGSFTMDMGPSRYFDPGTEWEGLVVPVTRKGVLLVPTDALIQYAGSVYLPVRVSTGITTPALTEVAAGVNDGRPILVLDDARLRSALRHRPEARPGEIEERIREEYLKAQPGAERPKRLKVHDDAYGEDPYSE